jgi:hypothetical protein
MNTYDIHDHHPRQANLGFSMNALLLSTHARRLCSDHPPGQGIASHRMAWHGMAWHEGIAGPSSPPLPSPPVPRLLLLGCL